MTNRIDFTKEDRSVIAEYVFSSGKDILIKSDAIRLIDVLHKHKLIDDVDKWKSDVENNAHHIVESLIEVLSKKISDDQGKEIMDEYYGK